jgi:hypothetical protein
LIDDADAATARATLGAGTVTGVTGTSPVVSSGGTAPAISMPAATAGAAGHMSAAYASKLDGIAAGANLGVAINVGSVGVGLIAICATQDNVNRNTAPGASISGSVLKLSINGTNPGSTLPGTWANVGDFTVSQIIGGGEKLGLFQRIA